LSYAASAWWTKARQTTTSKQLSKLQRYACLGITGAIRTTPTASMEVLLGLEPLDLYIDRMASQTYHRHLALGSDKRPWGPEQPLGLRHNKSAKMPSDRCLPEFIM